MKYRIVRCDPIASEPVLGASEAGLFSIVLTNHAAWDFGSHVAGRTFRLQIAQDAMGGWTNSWPADVLWPGGTPVSGATEANRFSLFAVVDNGTHWLMNGQGSGLTIQ
jgi:hypothetical protein